MDKRAVDLYDAVAPAAAMEPILSQPLRRLKPGQAEQLAGQTRTVGCSVCLEVGKGGGGRAQRAPTARLASPRDSLKPLDEVTLDSISQRLDVGAVLTPAGIEVQCAAPVLAGAAAAAAAGARAAGGGWSAPHCRAAWASAKAGTINRSTWMYLSQ